MLVPKTYGAQFPLGTRQFFLQAANVDAILRTMMKSGFSSLVDAAITTETGEGGKTRGVLYADGLDTRSGANLSVAIGNGMKRKIEDAKISTDGAVWMGGADVAEIARNREVVANTGIFLLENDRMLGLPFYVVTSFPAGVLLLGNFREGVAVGTWGPSPQIIVDVNSFSKSGQVQITGFMSLDVCIKRIGAFSVATGVS